MLCKTLISFFSTIFRFFFQIRFINSVIIIIIATWTTHTYVRTQYQKDLLCFVVFFLKQEMGVMHGV